ncbi:hypothetical protein [Leeuwenhoekiella sp. W20_SRS_FM14]|uniref:hypothetical protein n=1 Tax=Leeuwenhoekiella sp. W20_SRS_FM14 TaxID=3240270 RepID=UPI003F984EF1
MRKIILSTFFVMNFLPVFAQVGIGTTTPDQSSILDLSASNKGFLAPRINLTSVTNASIDGINLNANGLMIYNTNASLTGGNGVGYYFWNGGTWTAMKAAPAGTNWSLAGNTVTATDFLGSINSQPLIFKVNSMLSGKIDPSGSLNLGLSSSATVANATAIGSNAAATADNALALGFTSRANQSGAIAIGPNTISTQTNSLAIGTNARSAAENSIAMGTDANATAQNSIVIGSATRAGSFGVSIGNDAGKIATGPRSVAIGNNASTGTRSVSVGQSATTTGNDAVAIGNNSRAIADNATAIGANAFANQANTVILGSNADVGIGTSTPTAKLQVNGTLRFVDATPGDDNGKVLTSDANGNASWQSISGIPQIVAAGLVIPTGGSSAAFTTPKLFGATLARTSKGNYQVTFDPARTSANYIVNLANVDCNGNCDGSNYDDPAIAYRNRTATGFLIVVGDNDNGTTNRSDRDLEFSFSVIDF